MTGRGEKAIRSLANHSDWLATLAQMHHAEWSGVSPFKTPKQHAEKLRSRTGGSPLPSTYVMTVDDTVVGSVSLLKGDDIAGVRPDLSPWLSSLLVIPARRGRGFGRALVEHCVAESDRLGFAALHLWTNTHRRFYERLGWDTLEERVVGSLRATVMKRALGRPQRGDSSSYRQES